MTVNQFRENDNLSKWVLKFMNINENLDIILNLKNIQQLANQIPMNCISLYVSICTVRNSNQSVQK